MTPRVAEDRVPGAMQAGYWGSLLPAVWSFMRAARARGLGTAWTTLHLVHEREAAEVLGIPYADVAQGGLIPIAHTIGTDLKHAPRIPLDQIVHWNSW
jgi:nitroreductase